MLRWRIGCEVYGKDCPEEVDSFSRVTLTGLDRISRELAVRTYQMPQGGLPIIRNGADW